VRIVENIFVPLSLLKKTILKEELEDAVVDRT
jgi:hypothetical protein